MLRINSTDEGIRFEVKVQPRSSRNQIVGVTEGVLKIKLTAPPVDGEANRTLINFLSEILELPKKNIVLVRGEAARSKLVEIKGIDGPTLFKKAGINQG